MNMARDPWTDPDPQPGDFDADLDAIDPRYVEAHPGDPDAKLTIVVGVEGEDAERLQQLAARRRQRPAEVISSLLRSA
ncbi:hypothetical protein BDZ31_001359 [Conexibacter arvalis]|uniref:Uncharacterized protein n=2 Tax=Conexibacter arvalis TaxID=912552 RepID=A0A840IAB7_9ACTN|nr:hypothetical protein [Conexibacter arvalis]